MKTLFISYDGLLDPIGSSQILPYIKAISGENQSIHIISFEKKERFMLSGNTLLLELLESNIGWTPLIFSSKYGAFGKLYDLLKMYVVSMWLSLRLAVQTVHARGHVAAQICLLLKSVFSLNFIFDCRGLWVDERVNKGGWNLAKPFDNLQYKFFKWIEKKIFIRSDIIIVLTEAVIDEILKLVNIPRQNITVIPCCADYELFFPCDESSRVKLRSMLNIGDAIVLGYLGSIGPMYKFESYVRMVQLANSTNKKALGLIVTHDVAVAQRKLNLIIRHEEMKFFRIVTASRKEVPSYINCFDVMVNFLTYSYARIATSPTRNAESYACGVPVICNSGIGDVDLHTEMLDAGLILHDFNDSTLLDAVNQLESILLKGGERLRVDSRKIFGLEIAESRYKNVYLNLNK
jgi:glycosyltransferase involved in cell wall biosynthesis